MITRWPKLPQKSEAVNNLAILFFFFKTLGRLVFSQKHLRTKKSNPHFPNQLQLKCLLVSSVEGNSGLRVEF
jgi:hypothetical protein